MKKGLILFLYLLFSFTVSAQLKINELMPKNISAVRDEYTNYSMWVELYNASDRRWNWPDIFLATIPSSPRKWNPMLRPYAGGFEIFGFEREDRSGHASFKTETRRRRTLFIQSQRVWWLTKVHYPPQYRNVSYGTPHRWGR